jgi:tRNA-binding EMAP/Myf-like protein
VRNDYRSFENAKSKQAFDFEGRLELMFAPLFQELQRVLNPKISLVKKSDLVNLAPRNLRGVESQGMILMTTNAEGKLVL